MFTYFLSNEQVLFDIEVQSFFWVTLSSERYGLISEHKNGKIYKSAINDKKQNFQQQDLYIRKAVFFQGKVYTTKTKTYI